MTEHTLTEAREEMIRRAAQSAGANPDAFVAYYLTATLTRTEGWAELVNMAIDYQREENEVTVASD